jgi:hypothetical protein
MAWIENHQRRRSLTLDSRTLGLLAVHIREKRAKNRTSTGKAAQYQAAADSSRCQHVASYHLDAIRTIAMRTNLLHSDIAPLMRTGAPVAGAPWPEAVDA